jgi:hypothetical protein
MLSGELSLDQLTPAQQSFAEACEAQRSVRGAYDGEVFLYWEGQLDAYRWLVDRQGVVREVTRFTH